MTIEINPEYAELFERFKRSFKRADGVICFLLDHMPRETLDGLILSSLRRAALFHDYLDVNVMFLTNQYQSRGPENTLMQLELGRAGRLRVLNLYDYLQGIDRSVAVPQDYSFQPLPYIDPSCTAEPVEGKCDTLVKNEKGQCVMYIGRYPSGEGIDFVNYLAESKLYRRDTFDIQGFLSRTEFLNPQDGKPRSTLFFRPDGTVALTVTHRLDGDRVVDDAIELMDRQGRTFQRFASHDELVAFWLLSLLRNPSCHYFLISELAQHHMRAFQEFERLREQYPNVHIICQPHNVHVIDAREPFTARLGDTYRYLADRSMKVDVAVPLTEWQKEDIKQRFGNEAPPRLEVIPHALFKGKSSETDRSQEVTLPTRAIIMVGRLNAQKQQDQAILTLKEIVKKVPDATLHFCGDGPDEQKLRDLAAEQKLSDKVVFHGFVPDLSSVYSQAALLLMSSKAEAFPLVLLEALSAGCPCVSFDCRYGPSAMIEDGKNGFLVTPGDTATLAERCVQILLDARLRKKLSAGAVKSTERFQPPVIAAKWAELLLSLLPENDLSSTDSSKPDETRGN